RKTPSPARRTERGRNRIRGPDPELSCGRIGQEADLADALFELVKDSNATFDEGPTILGWLDALRTAVEETNAEVVLHVGDRLRNGRLRRCECLRRFHHAP